MITAPSKPEGPFVIYREPKAVVLKWWAKRQLHPAVWSQSLPALPRRYPGEGGAHKYVLQSKFIDTLDAQARGAPARAHGQVSFS